MTYFDLIGLVLNFVGSIIMTISVVANPNGAHQMVKGKKVFLASILANRFKIGVGIFSFGFLLQLISALCSIIK